MTTKHPSMGATPHLYNNFTGSRVRTFSVDDKNIDLESASSQRNVHEEKCDVASAKLSVNLHDNTKDSVIVELSDCNSLDAHFHTRTHIPFLASDLTLEIHKNDERKSLRRALSVEQGDLSGGRSALCTPLLKQSFVMALWFISSFATIVLNKYLLSTLNVDLNVLAGSQILITTFLSGLMMYLTLCRPTRKHKETSDHYHFYKTILILGSLKCGAVICSVVGLKYVAVSFSETIKSSAPLFTAIMAYMILGEYSGLYVNMSLMPIMFGLAISTYTEISFNLTGFLAACTNNLLDCIQNVFSKKLLTGEETKFSPLELQFYTSVAATMIQSPLWVLVFDISGRLHNIDRYVALMLLFNCIIFALQSLFAYSLMSLISPVTFSVSNTVKRAGLIWFSILVFGNKVTWWNGFGTVCVMGGVFLYQRARLVEAVVREQMRKS